MTIPHYRETMMSLDPSTSIPSVFCWATFLSKDLGFNIWFAIMKGTWLFNTLKGMARSCEKWCLKDIERLCWELHFWRHYQLFHSKDQFWGWFEVVNLQVFRCFKKLMDHEFIQARSSRDIRRIQKDSVIKISFDNHTVNPSIYIYQLKSSLTKLRNCSLVHA